jgi:Mycobacterium membrane protein
MHPALLAGLIVLAPATSPVSAALVRGHAVAAGDAGGVARTLAPPGPWLPRTAAAAPASAGIFRVTYRVSGQAASATIDYRTRGGPIEHIVTKSLPWAVSLDVPGGESLHVTASGRALWGESSIICEILVDGVARAKAAGAGFVAVATCKATVK